MRTTLFFSDGARVSAMDPGDSALGARVLPR
jgi:hypothetical protein